MRKLYPLLLIILFIFIPVYVAAEDSVQNISPTIGEMRREMIEKMNSQKERMRKQALELKESRDQFLQDLKGKQNAMKEEMEKKRTEMQEKLSAKREEFKEKIKTLRDEKKKEIVEKLDTNMAAINTRQTNQLTHALSRLSSLVAEFEQAIQEAKTAGKDTTSADTAIAEAKAAMSAAQAAVAEQAGKDYVITIDTEENLRMNVGEAHIQLRTDMKAAHEKVMAAKDAVKKLARVMHEYRKKGMISIIPTISSSPVVTPVL